MMHCNMNVQLALYYMASRNDTKQCTLLAVLMIFRSAGHVPQFSYNLLQVPRKPTTCTR